MLKARKKYLEKTVFLWDVNVYYKHLPAVLFTPWLCFIPAQNPSGPNFFGISLLQFFITQFLHYLYLFILTSLAQPCGQKHCQGRRAGSTPKQGEKGMLCQGPAGWVGRKSWQPPWGCRLKVWMKVLQHEEDIRESGSAEPVCPGQRAAGIWNPERLSCSLPQRQLWEYPCNDWWFETVYPNSN